MSCESRVRDALVEGCRDGGLSPEQCYELLVLVAGDPWKACRFIALGGENPGKDVADLTALLRHWARKQWEK